MLYLYFGLTRHFELKKRMFRIHTSREDPSNHRLPKSHPDPGQDMAHRQERVGPQAVMTAETAD